MASFLEDYRTFLRTKQPDAPKTVVPTVGVQQEYRAVAKPYLKWDVFGVTVVLPTDKVGAPPVERPFWQDTETGQWVVNRDAINQMDSTPSRMFTVGEDEYRVTADGRVFKQHPPLQGDILAAAATGAPVPNVEEEVTGDQIPVSIQSRSKAVANRVTIDVSGQQRTNDGQVVAGGVTSPGGYRPDGANPANFYGSEYLTDEEGMTAEQVATYRTRIPDIRPADIRALMPGLDKDTPVQGTYYQRYQADLAMREGLGRPMYAPNSGGSVSSILGGLAPGKLMQVQYAMMQAGYLPSTYMPSTVVGADLRSKFAELLADANLNGDSWTSVLVKMMGSPKVKDITTDGGGSGGTSTSTQISLTSRAGAEQLIKQAWQQQYGKAPTEQEMAQFASALRGAERADPTTTTTTYEKDGDSSSVTRQSEVDPTAEAMSFAEDANPKERREYMALNYFNLLAGMTGG